MAAASSNCLTTETVSLEDGLRLAAESARFDERQMRELRQAAAALRKAIDRNGATASIPLNPPQLRPLLATAMRFGFRAGRKRRSNIKSAIVTLAIAAGVHASREVIAAPLTAEWQTLRASIDDETAYSRMKLGRFMSYCSHRGIPPAAVDSDTIRAFERHLLQETLCLHCGEVVRVTVRAWNACAGTLPDWPAGKVEKPDHRNTYAFAITAFSSAFQDDLSRYLDFLAKPNRHDRRMAGRGLAEDTRRFYKDLLLRAASILVRGGTPIAELTGVKDLVVPERVERILDFLDERFGNEPNSQTANMATCLSVAGRRWVKLPEDGQKALADLARSTRLQSRGLTERNRRRLHPFQTPAGLAKLTMLPKTLAARAKRLLAEDSARAVQTYEAALGIELATLFLLRLRTLSMIEISDFKTDDRGRINRLFIASQKSKTRDPIDAVLKEGTAEMVETYIKVYRPLRRGAASSNWLFLNLAGKRITRKNLGERIARTVEAEMHVPFNTHLFRHIAATVALEQDPNNLALLKTMLSHGALKTIDRMYGARMSSGSLRKWGNMLQAGTRPANNSDENESGQQPGGSRRRRRNPLEK